MSRIHNKRFSVEGLTTTLTEGNKHDMDTKNG